MQPVEPIDPPPPTENPPPGALPGLGAYLVPRYTCNTVINDESRVLDVLHEVIFRSSRMFMTQGADGKIRMLHKKPADYAYAATVLSIGGTTIEVDNVAPWINNWAYHLLIDAHTLASEIRSVTNAIYPTSQNSTILTTSHTGTAFTVVGFAGANGAQTPATASITVNSFVADTEYTVTLEAAPIVFKPSTGDTTSTIAGFIAGAIAGSPYLSRRFKVEWASGTSVVNLTARFGTLTVNSAFAKTHVAPVVNPPTPPTILASAGALKAGAYKVMYTEVNVRGETVPSPFAALTLLANQKIDVSAVVPSVAGNTIRWYVTPEPGSKKSRLYLENSGAAHSINALPKLSAPLPPDLNRTGTEVMRVKAVFSDRAETRSSIGASNVLKGTFEWLLSNQKKAVNRIDLKYRERTQDYRLIELRLRDDAHIAKVHKTTREAINGQAIDNGFQAYRVAASELSEYRDGDFAYKWSATRAAMLIEEADVVCITDDGSGVYNLPVFVTGISFSLDGSGIPRVAFTATKYSTSHFDDSVNDRRQPVVSEAAV